MIFTFGATFLLFGWLLANLLGSGLWEADNWADYIGAGMSLLGMAGIIVSFLVLAWQWLP
jgi:hypothetical protein